MIFRNWKLFKTWKTLIFSDINEKQLRTSYFEINFTLINKSITFLNKIISSRRL
jgi:hypothetical protein